MNRVKRLLKVSARTDANVLLCGETGVGKDLLASTIHKLSHRKKGPYVKVGCTTFPSTLIENELFGHDEGSFTGADRSRPGRFELAKGGSIYLDDVDDIPLEHQPKLLRASEEKVFERVGGTQLIQADVRIIASTKLNLLDKVSEGTFRKDLYYRLDVLRIRVPPLRDRREDIPELTDHLFRRIIADQPGKIDHDAVKRLAEHDWPGNVRELYHTLERAWLIGSGHITVDVLEAEIAGQSAGRADAAAASSPPVRGFKAAMEHAEKQLLLSALAACGGNKTAAAHSLAMKPSTFRDKLSKHRLA
jgi:DNA-binding NtrC family response regulator